MKHAALRRLRGIPDVKVEERVYRGEDAVGEGRALVLWAEAETVLVGADSLAERGKPSERIGGEAAASLGAEIESQATLDVHAADQLLVYMARANGPSRFRVRSVSGHLETMMWLGAEFLPCRLRVTRRRGGGAGDGEAGAAADKAGCAGVGRFFAGLVS